VGPGGGALGPRTVRRPPTADLIICDPDLLEAVVTEEVGSSALFASRFRECAARALLLPRRDPRSRSPLWQQRMRSAQLLSVAARYQEFPIVLETMRECLTDVFDLESLLDVQRQIASRSIRLVEIETTEPSPFAKSLLFGYVGAFVYEGDVPLAEKKAAALSLDATLLAELLGKDGLKQLLDGGVIATTEADLQGLSDERKAHTTEQLFDLVRTAGPFTVPELTERSTTIVLDDALDELLAARRLVRVRIAGAEMVAVAEDVTRLRDGLGIPVPPGVAASFGEVVEHPVNDLVLRWARTHGPFLASVVARRYGLGISVVESAAETLTAPGTLVSGSFVDIADEESVGDRRQYCHAQVLALVKRRTLALLRHGVEPVLPVAYARFLGKWQGVGTGARGVDALLSTIEQLAGYPMPASSVESVVLPARVSDYHPAMLDELTSSGEVYWVGDGPVGEADGWVRFYTAEMEPCPPRAEPQTPRAAELLGAFSPGGAYFFDGLLRAVGTERDVRDVHAGDVNALWDLVWAGLITGDTFSPLRALAAGGTLKRPRKAAPRAHRTRPGQRPTRARGATRLGAPSTAGRWSLVERAPTDTSIAASRSRLAADVFSQLDRYGVVTRGSVLTEELEGGFGSAYRALSALEESGQCRRGYFIDGLGAAQFALAGAVDRLREELSEPEQATAVVLAACDPANPYGAALPWPDREGHRPGRKAGSLVALVNGHLVFYVERGGRSLLSFTDDPAQLQPATAALARSVRLGLLGKLTVERADGGHVFSSGAVSKALQEAGFQMTPQGLRLRPAPA